MHYTNVKDSLLHAINHRYATDVHAENKESRTGQLLNTCKKPAALITSEVAATQLFAMPEDTMTAANLFWSGLTGAKPTSNVIAGNPSSMLGNVKPNKGKAGQNSSTVGLTVSPADNDGL